MPALTCPRKSSIGPTSRTGSRRPRAEKASQYTYKSDRNLVVFTTGNAYLLVISDMATVDSVRAQVKTAQTLVQNDVDLNKHGLIASIDLLRARVEFQTQQQRLIAAENQVAIDKLTLARVIGLPNGQEFRLTDSVPYASLDGITQEQALQQAYSTRPDYLSAKAQVRAAELARQAVAAENYPSLSTDTNYGDIGSPNFGTSHGTLGFAAHFERSHLPRAAGCGQISCRQIRHCNSARQNSPTWRARSTTRCARPSSTSSPPPNL